MSLTFLRHYLSKAIFCSKCRGELGAYSSTKDTMSCRACCVCCNIPLISLRGFVNLKFYMIALLPSMKRRNTNKQSWTLFMMVFVTQNNKKTKLMVENDDNLTEGRPRHLVWGHTWNFSDDFVALVFAGLLSQVDMLLFKRILDSFNFNMGVCHPSAFHFTWRYLWITFVLVIHLAHDNRDYGLCRYDLRISIFR